jgi:hypothetical protein
MKKKFSAADGLPTALTPEQLEASRQWRPEQRHMTSTAYYKQHGRAPKGHVVYIGGRVYDEAGEVRGVVAGKDPVRLGEPQGWRGTI